MTKEYIAYRGERPIGIGTLEELSQKVGIPARILKKRSYPSIQEVLADDSIKIYEIEDDEDDNQIKPERL